MNLFGKQMELEEALDGKVLARITIDKVDRKTRKVTAFVVERSTGRTVFKLRYTSDKDEIPCYYEAENYVKAFIKDHNFIIDGKIEANISLPYVRTVTKRSR